MMDSSTHSGGSLARIIFKNTAFVTAGNLILRGLNFLFMVLVVRTLGDARFGQYSVVLAFVGLFQVFAELGISQFVMREAARDKANVLRYFWNLVLLRLLLAVLGIIGITLAGSRAGYSEEIILGIFLYTTTFLLAAFESPLFDLFQAYEKMKEASLLVIIGQIAFIIFGAIFLLSGLSYFWLIVASLISFLPRIALGFWMAVRQRMLPPVFSIQPRLWLDMIRSGFPFGIITLTMTIDTSIDTLILKSLESDQVVGWYNVAHNFIFSLLSITRGFRTAIVPSLARTYNGDATTVREWFYRSVKFSWLFSIPVAVGGMMIATPLILFLYDQTFIPAGPLLQVFIWDYPLRMYTSLCGQMATVIQAEKQAARINIINAIANVILNFIFIPQYGMMGAAVVSVATDAISAIQFYFLMRLHLKPRSTLPDFLRILAASAVMGGVVWLANDLHVLISVAIGAVVFVICAGLFRVLDATEWEWMKKALHLAHRAARDRLQAGNGK